jgi:hypothetical protein
VEKKSTKGNSGAGNGGITEGKSLLDETAVLLMKWGKDEMTWYKERARWKWRSGRR